MASFTKGGTPQTPFGVNQYLASTKDLKFAPYSLAGSTITPQTIDGVPNQKIVQRGLLLAKITSGVDTGKVGPYQGGTVVNEVQTITITGAPAGGTFTLSFRGEATAPIAFNATNATIQAALIALPAVGPNDLTVTGAGPFTVTFAGNLAGQNVPQILLETNSLTGGTTPTVVIATTTTGGVSSGAATDGRGDPLNIVGINDTFLPWQTIERDVEVGVCYNAAVVQAWCLEYDAAGAMVAMSNATAEVLRNRLKGASFLVR